MNSPYGPPPYVLHTPEEIAQQLAGKVRALRLHQGLKQSTLAARSGVSLGSLKRFESTGQGSLKNLLRIVLALGRLDDFIPILEAPPARSIDELARRQGRPKPQRGRL
ncbi:MAG: helix-turn-helix transcriptional regulator [Acidobacteriota bacterium]